MGYLRAGQEDSEASQEMFSSLIVVSALYLLLLLPVLPRYKYIEKGIVTTEEESEEDQEQHRVGQLLQHL